MRAPLTPKVKELVLTVMEGLRCPRALTIAVMLRHDMWQDLIKLDLQTHHYPDADSYRRAAAATKFLSKLETRIDGLDPKRTAWEKWLEAEKQCFRTNLRLNTLLDYGPVDHVDERCLDFLSTVRKNVEWLIGNAPPLDVRGKFGPGATISDISGRTTVAHKISSIPTLTTEATNHLCSWGVTRWAYASRKRFESPKIVRGNHYFQVPKTAMTNRSCAKEPSINAFYQRGYGSVMAARLAQKGINIAVKRNPYYKMLGISHFEGYEVASEAHRRVVELASRDDSFATIDLSNASDTQCTALVRAVIPRRWFQVLNSLRSSYTKAHGAWYKLEKFSSMGNGFTFELETTIFAAICLAVDPCLTPGVDLFVFGDDIIVPRRIALDVIAALAFCGLETNGEKTFISSDFKESCGGDYFRGEAVRPYYLKKEPNEPQDFIAMANGIRRMGRQDIGTGRLFRDLLPAWFRILDCIPSHVRKCRGPEQLGDLVINDEQRTWQIKYRQQKGYIRVYRPVRPPLVSWNRFDADVQFAAATYGLRFVRSKYSHDNQRAIPMRGDVGGYKVGWVSYG